MKFARSLRRAVALTVAVAALAIGATAVSSAVAPASAEAAVWVRVICQDVYLRHTPGGPVTPTYMADYGQTMELLAWPTNGWANVGVYGGSFWVDANCVTLA